MVIDTRAAFVTEIHDVCAASVPQRWDPGTGQTWCLARHLCLKLLPWRPPFHPLPYMSMNNVHMTGRRYIQTGNTWRDQIATPAVTTLTSQLDQYLWEHAVPNNQDVPVTCSVSKKERTLLLDFYCGKKCTLGKNSSDFSYVNHYVWFRERRQIFHHFSFNDF